MTDQSHCAVASHQPERRNVMNVSFYNLRKVETNSPISCNHKWNQITASCLHTAERNLQTVFDSDVTSSLSCLSYQSCTYEIIARRWIGSNFDKQSFQSFVKQNCEIFASLILRICCMSSSFMIVSEESLVFGLTGNITLVFGKLWWAFFSSF